jgi:hypothetical protein
MSNTIESLRTDFMENINIYLDLLEKRDVVSEKVSSMKERYNELVKQNNKPMFLFCLESLFFQYKILNLEMENYYKSSSLIENRIYGDYYKLYNMIVIQCNENNIQLDIDTNESILPIYKDVDPFFKYRLEDIERVHERILSVIDIMNKLNTTKKEIVQNYRENIAVGFSLKLFLQTLDYEIYLIQDQIQLFINYVIFYHSSQRTYLEKLVKKIVIFTEELDDHILIYNIPVETELISDIHNIPECNVDQDGQASIRAPHVVLKPGSLGLLCPGQVILAEDTGGISEFSSDSLRKQLDDPDVLITEINNTIESFDNNDVVIESSENNDNDVVIESSENNETFISPIINLQELFLEIRNIQDSPDTETNELCDLLSGNFLEIEEKTSLIENLNFITEKESIVDFSDI